MYCPKCGKHLDSTAKFCGNCGNRIEIGKESPYDTQIPETVLPNTVERKKFEEGVCPQCGSNNCEIQVQQNISGSGSNFNLGTGCLGFLLAGPFGLLCGLCGTGSSTVTTHQSMWVCKNCGKQFPTKANLVKSILSGGGMIGILFGMWASCLLLAACLCLSDFNAGFAFAFLGSLILAPLSILFARQIKINVVEFGGCEHIEEFLTTSEYIKFRKYFLVGFLIFVCLTIFLIILSIINRIFYVVV